MSTDHIDNKRILEWVTEHEDELIEFVNLTRLYPNETVLNLWEQVFPQNEDVWPDQ